MTDNLEIIATVLFVLVGLLMMWGAFASKRMLSLLRHRHPEIWFELGSPTLFARTSIGDYVRTNMFVWGKKYLKLEDEDLIHACATLRRLVLVLVPVWLVFIFVVLNIIADSQAASL